MFGNDRRMSQELDNHITGHYGEDQFKDTVKAKARRIAHNRQRREIKTGSSAAHLAGLRAASYVREPSMADFS